MIYYTSYIEWDKNNRMTCGPKGMGDVRDVMESLGIETIVFPAGRSGMKLSIRERLSMERRLYRLWEDKCACLKAGDWLIVDIPLLERFLLHDRIIRKLKARGVKIAFFIVELQLLTNAKYRRASALKSALIKRNERFVLENADLILAHNEVYKEKLKELGVSCRIECFEIFDYLAPDFDVELAGQKREGRDGAVIIAANLKPEKAAYVNSLPHNHRFNLYGVNYCGQSDEQIQYRGAFDSMELMYAVEGSYGLVWDGDSAEGCTGNFGGYLRYNNPHKTSFYLASGIPVIVWKEAAIAKFILDNRCGFAVEKLSDIAAVTEKITEEDYEEMRKNAERVGERLRKGYYTKRVVRAAFGIGE